MRIFNKGDEYASISDKYVYKIETYVAWNKGYALQKEFHISCTKPIKKFPKKFLCTKKTKNDKWWLLRFVSLQYAPENYLINDGYKEVS